MKKLALIILFVSLVTTNSELKSSNEPTANVRFEISFPETSSKEALDGRLLLLISTNNQREPRSTK